MSHTEQTEIQRLTAELAKSRVQEMRNYSASPAMKTFAELKHSKAGTVLAMLGDGAISRGKCCEVLAQLAHGVPFDEIPLPEENGRQFSEDEIPAEVVAKLEAELAAEREINRDMVDILKCFVNAAHRPCGHTFDCVCHHDRAREIIHAADTAQSLPITTGDPIPCPLCGGKAEMAFYQSRNNFWVRCTKNIFHAGPHKPSEAEALVAWNEPLVKRLEGK